MRVLNFVAMAAIAAVAIAVGPGQAKADKLDDVINNGKLRCGVVLERFPITRGHIRQQRNSFRIPLV